MKRSLFILFAIAILSGCSATVPATEIEIFKPIRHYPPVTQGTTIKIAYQLKNTGKYPFIFEEILPDNTSITTVGDTPHLLPPKDSVTLVFHFKTNRNVGLTKHKIRVFGNVNNPQDSLGVYRPGVLTMTFDVPIVHPSADRSDYEEIYFDSKPEVEFLIDGTIEEIAGQNYY